MKKVFTLSILALGLVGCDTINRTPNTGGMGEYGFTYDLNGSPSPFVDTSYRPLTVYDLAAPSVVIVTNRPPPTIVYQNGPEIGVTKYAGESPGRAAVVGVGAGQPGQQLNEAAGAQRGTAAAGIAPATGYPAGAAASGGGYYGGVPGVAVFVDGDTNVVGITNTNSITNSVSLTNTNNLNLAVTNTNNVNVVSTNRTNLNFAGTNSVVNDPAGSQAPTNRFVGQPFPAQKTGPGPVQSSSNNVNTFNGTVAPPAPAPQQDNRGLLNSAPPAGNAPVPAPQNPAPAPSVAPRQGGIQPQPR